MFWWIWKKNENQVHYVKIFGFWNKANSTNFCFGAYKVDVMSTLQVQNGTKYDWFDIQVFDSKVETVILKNYI